VDNSPTTINLTVLRVCTTINFLAGMRGGNVGYSVSGAAASATANLLHGGNGRISRRRGGAFRAPPCLIVEPRKLAAACSLPVVHGLAAYPACWD
jgi:hypothetical protein